MAGRRKTEEADAPPEGVSVFISYSHKNTELKRKVEAALLAAGCQTRSDEDIVEGTDYRSDIARLIRASTVTVVLWTEEAFSTRWVADEAHLADELANRDGRLRYIGVIIDPVLDRLPFPLTNRQNLNLSGTGLDGAGLGRLVAVVTRFAALQGLSLAPPASVSVGVGAPAAEPGPKVAPKPAAREIVGLAAPVVPDAAPDAALDAAREDSLDEAAKELQFFTDAQAAGTPQALRAYLAHFPKGDHRAAAEERLAELTSPVQRARKRLIGAGAALGTVIALVLAAYPVLKDMTAPPANLSDLAARPVAELAAAVPPGSDPPAEEVAAVAAPEPAPKAGSPAVEPAVPPVVASLPPAALVEPPLRDRAPVLPAAQDAAPAFGPVALLAAAPAAADPWTPPDTTSFDLNLSPLVADCDAAAGSAAFARDLERLGRKVVPFEEIDPARAIPTCRKALAAFPNTPRMLSNLGLSLEASGEADPSLYARDAADLYDEWCRTRGKAGAVACVSRGLMFQNGHIDNTVDVSRALYHHLNACHREFALGCLYAAQLLQEEERLKDSERAVGLLETGCELKSQTGSAESCNYLGSMYLNGEVEGKENRVRAAGYFQMSCDAGLAKGCENNTVLFREMGGSANFNIARLSAEKACAMVGKEGSASACNQLGIMYAQGEIEAANTVELAVDAFGRACTQNYDWGCVNAAWTLLDTSARDDAVLAADFATRACASSESDVRRQGCSALGEVHLSDAFGRDLAGAIDAFSKGCAFGAADGCERAADLIREAGVAGTAQEALRLAKVGCGLKDSPASANACITAGFMYYNGEVGRGPDLQLAGRWFSLACDQGSADGCSNAALSIWPGGPVTSHAHRGAIPLLGRACELEADKCAIFAEFFRNAPDNSFDPKLVAAAYLDALEAGDSATLGYLEAGSVEPDVLTEIQSLLGQTGHDIGTPTGKVGPKTRAALEAVCDCAG